MTNTNETFGVEQTVEVNRDTPEALANLRYELSELMSEVGEPMDIFGLEAGSNLPIFYFLLHKGDYDPELQAIVNQHGAPTADNYALIMAANKLYNQNFRSSMNPNGRIIGNEYEDFRLDFLRRHGFDDTLDTNPNPIMGPNGQAYWNEMGDIVGDGFTTWWQDHAASYISDADQLSGEWGLGVTNTERQTILNLRQKLGEARNAEIDGDGERARQIIISMREKYQSLRPNIRYLVTDPNPDSNRISNTIGGGLNLVADYTMGTAQFIGASTLGLGSLAGYGKDLLDSVGTSVISGGWRGDKISEANAALGYQMAKNTAFFMGDSERYISPRVGETPEARDRQLFWQGIEKQKSFFHPTIKKALNRAQEIKEGIPASQLAPLSKSEVEFLALHIRMTQYQTLTQAELEALKGQPNLSHAAKARLMMTNVNTVILRMLERPENKLLNSTYVQEHQRLGLLTSLPTGTYDPYEKMTEPALARLFNGPELGVQGRDRNRFQIPLIGSKATYGTEILAWGLMYAGLLGTVGIPILKVATGPFRATFDGIGKSLGFVGDGIGAGIDKIMPGGWFGAQKRNQERRLDKEKKQAAKDPDKNPITKNQFDRIRNSFDSNLGTGNLKKPAVKKLLTALNKAGVIHGHVNLNNLNLPTNQTMTFSSLAKMLQNVSTKESITLTPEKIRAELQKDLKANQVPALTTMADEINYIQDARKALMEARKTLLLTDSEVKNKTVTLRYFTENQTAGGTENVIQFKKGAVEKARDFVLGNLDKIGTYGNSKLAKGFTHRAEVNGKTQRVTFRYNTELRSFTVKLGNNQPVKVANFALGK